MGHPALVMYKGECVGQMKADLMINDNVVVQGAVGDEIRPDGEWFGWLYDRSVAHFTDHLRYYGGWWLEYNKLRAVLRATGAQVGLLVCFASKKVDMRRVEPGAPRTNNSLIPIGAAGKVVNDSDE